MGMKAHRDMTCPTTPLLKGWWVFIKIRTGCCINFTHEKYGWTCIQDMYVEMTLSQMGWFT